MSAIARRAARVDENQAAIVDALRRVGVAVEVIGKPVDLIICVRRPGGPEDGETSLMEVKNPERTSEDRESRLTDEQKEFIARWPGKVHIVRTVPEALMAALGDAMG